MEEQNSRVLTLFGPDSGTLKLIERRGLCAGLQGPLGCSGDSVCSGSTGFCLCRFWGGVLSPWLGERAWEVVPCQLPAPHRAS